MSDEFMGERVPGKVKDKLPVIPDHVAEAMDKGVDVPIEAFSLGDARDRLQDEIANRNRPVRLQDLTPVAKGDERISHYYKRDGNQLPLVPQHKRVIPPPYQRPAATIRQDHGREWAFVTAEQVRKDDIVVDFGKVTDVETKLDHKLRSDVLGITLENMQDDDLVAVGTIVFLTNVEGRIRAYSPGAQLRAFVPASVAGSA